MKMNWKVLKEPKFIIGGIVLFFVVLYMLNKSGSTSSGAITAAPAPPVDNTIPLAQIQASVANNNTAAALSAIQNQDATQIALAQLGANSQDYQSNLAAAIAAAGIAEQGHEADLSAQIAALGIGAETTAATLQYQTNLATLQASQNMAAMAYSAANYAVATNAQVTEYLSNNQLEAYQIGTEANLVTSMKGSIKYGVPTVTAFINAQQPIANNAPGLIAPPTYNYGSLA